MREYAFDVVLRGVVRVDALSQEAAVRAIDVLLDAVTPGEEFVRNFNELAVNLRIAEVSLDQDSIPQLFEIDGREV